MERLKYMPDELIFTHILPRLPVKSLVRFESVSKQWLSTISSSSFVKSHLKNSRSRPQFFLEMKGDYHNWFLLSEDGNAQASSGRLANNVHIVGCCNGLISLFTCSPRSNYRPIFDIWNPAIREWFHVRSPNPRFNVIGFPLRFVASGFGFASSVDDYKLALLYKTDCEQFIEIDIFSVKQGVWKQMRSRRLESVFYRNCVSLFSEAVSIDGTLYWSLRESDRRNHIVRLDLVSEEIQVYPLPMPINYDVELKLFALEGRLSLCYVYDKTNNEHHKWTLKRNAHDLSCSTNWEKSTNRVDFGSGNLLKVSDSGRCLVEHRIGQCPQLEVRDLNRKVARTLSQGKRADFTGWVENVWCYFESLVTLPKATNQAII